ncbi:MAG: hypothetical protein GY754_24065 [bacterium]|nr:hypothetical protein [bacterium]
MNTTNENEIFDELLTKTRLKKPIPPNEREFSRKSARKMHIAVLKKAGRYRPLYGVILYVFHFMTGLGIKVSVVQSAVLLGVVSIVLAGSVSSGTYAVIQYASTDEPLMENVVHAEAVTPVIPDKPGPVKAKPKNQAKLHITVKGDGINKTILAPVKQKLEKFFSRNIGQTKKRYWVNGEVSEIGNDSVLVSLAVQDITNLKVRTEIYANNKMMKKNNDIFPVLLKMSQESLKEIAIREKK